MSAVLPAVTVRNVWMSFPGKQGAVHVLEDINAEVGRGEFVCIVGPSGCGKSTLLNIVGGFLKATSGEVLVEGEPVRGPDPRRIFVFQENGVFPWLNVRENIAFGLRALDHEDPRYVHSGEAGVLKRARHAIGQTFIARNAHGDTMPAYSIFASGLATPFVADAWRPEPVKAGRELRSGGMTIGMKAVNNLVLEFWPDIRKKLRR